VFQAACDRYGITRCNSIDEMVDFALAFLPRRWPEGNRLAVVTSSGGAVGLVLDAVGSEKGVLATLEPGTVRRMEDFIPEDADVNNPMDAGPSLASDVPGFCSLCRMFADDPNVDLLAVQGRIPLPDDRNRDPEPYRALAAATDKPVLAFSRMVQNADQTYRDFQDGAGMPVLFGIPATVRALHALVRYGARRRAGIPEPAPGAAGVRAIPRDALPEALAGYGVTPPRQAVARSPREAADAARTIGFPVALKVVAGEAIHKTEIGGVRLGLADAGAVEREAKDLVQAMAGRGLEGFIVQEMVAGVELLVGARDDEQFGPLLVVGLGGVFVELLRDVSLRLLPIGAAEVRTMLEDLRAASVFKGFRGQGPRDVAAVIDAVTGLSRFFLEHREQLSEIEINPLIVLGEGAGVRAVDVRVVRRK
jgi:acetyltransferase